MAEKKPDTRRKVVFNLNPDSAEPDRLVCDLLANLPTAQRGRVMRQMLLAGAALHMQATAAPAVIGEALTEGQTIDQLRSLLSGVLPELFGAPAAPASQYAPPPPPAKNAADKGLADSFGID